MKVELKPLEINERENFIKDLQEAFRVAAIEEFGKNDEEVITKTEIEESLNSKGAQTFRITKDGKNVGGIIISINEETQCNSLELFFVNQNCQSEGVGLKAWRLCEEKFPQTKIWETVTPYFEKRNIHFYVNRCGFKIVEFFNPRHKDQNMPDAIDREDMKYFFRFEKKMRD